MLSRGLRDAARAAGTLSAPFARGLSSSSSAAFSFAALPPGCLVAASSVSQQRVKAGASASTSAAGTAAAAATAAAASAYSTAAGRAVARRARGGGAGAGGVLRGGGRGCDSAGTGTGVAWAGASTQHAARGGVRRGGVAQEAALSHPRLVHFSRDKDEEEDAGRVSRASCASVGGGGPVGGRVGGPVGVGRGALGVPGLRKNAPPAFSSCSSSTFSSTAAAAASRRASSSPSSSSWSSWLWSPSSSSSSSAAAADGYKSLKSALATKTDAANDRRALHAVNVAIKANAAIFVCKICAYGVTGSSAMLAEAVHSVADIVNQGLLRVGINSSTKAPDTNFNYGYRRERFVWSLISAVGIFFMGSGVSVMHGLHGIFHPGEIEHIWVGLSVLGVSAVIDAYSLTVAYTAGLALAHAVTQSP